MASVLPAAMVATELMAFSSVLGQLFGGVKLGVAGCTGLAQAVGRMRTVMWGAMSLLRRICRTGPRVKPLSSGSVKTSGLTAVRLRLGTSSSMTAMLALRFAPR